MTGWAPPVLEGTGTVSFPREAPSQALTSQAWPSVPPTCTGPPKSPRPENRGSSSQIQYPGETDLLYGGEKPR